MKNIKYLIYGISIIFLVSGCKQQVANYVLEAEVVEIFFTKNTQNGDWFKLDDLLFTHVVNDTTDLVNQEEYSHMQYFENSSQEFIDKGFLPASILHYHIQGDINQDRVPTSRIAAMFVRRLYQKQDDLSPNQTVYQIGDAGYLIMGGRVFVKRSDDQKILVTSNAPDRIMFSPLLKTDKTYKSLFEKNKPG